ncbi:MAG: phosphatidate cytidylyltransferase [Saprospiraceae bacterium]|nr:phosphatidate cytidylyltransferase [Saprospiraceae bacterium]
MSSFSTLKTRSKTAVFYGLAVILLLNHSIHTVNIFLLLVSILTAFEFFKIRMNGAVSKFFIILTALVFGSLPMAIEYFFKVLSIHIFEMLLGIIIIYDIYLIVDLFKSKKLVNSNKLVIIAESLLYIGIPFMLYMFVQQHYLSDFFRTLFILILLIWVNDSFAYFVGSRFGKHKLLPEVSPKKSIEGFVGGGVFAVLASFLLHYFYGYFDFSFYFVAALIVFIIGTAGDLVESKLKRIYNLKDSGNALPGHGGFLDRFDSFLFSLPFITALVYLLVK